jgi:hypothetical protein
MREKGGETFGYVERCVAWMRETGEEACDYVERDGWLGRDEMESLKVDGNEKQWGPGRRQMLGNGLGPWRSRFIFNMNMQFLSKMSYFLRRFV